MSEQEKKRQRSYLLHRKQPKVSLSIVYKVKKILLQKWACKKIWEGELNKK